MPLFHRHLAPRTRRCRNRDGCVVALVEVGRLPMTVRWALETPFEMAAGNRTMTVALALSYGGRQDIVAAARRIARAVAKGRITPDQGDEPLISRELATSGPPDPDFLIRPTP